MKKTMLTPKQAKALDILRNNPGCTVNGFAAHYFDGHGYEYLFTAY